MIGLRGTKRYNRSLRRRLPNGELSGIIRDLRLHLNIEASTQSHIFVVGPPRSGTTLVRGIVAAHSRITTTDRETFFFTRRRISLFSMEELPEFPDFLASARTKVELFDRIAARMRERDHADFFMEKTPEHALVLPALLKWFPCSKFVFVVRDGRDGYSSAFRNPKFHSKVGDEYPRLWRDCVKNYLKNRKKPNLMLLRYEALTQDPKKSIQDLMDFLDIPFEKHQLSPQSFSNTSMAKQVGHEKLSEHINASSVGAYRMRLSKQQIDFFEKRAVRELRSLGYDV